MGREREEDNGRPAIPVNKFWIDLMKGREVFQVVLKRLARLQPGDSSYISSSRGFDRRRYSKRCQPEACGVWTNFHNLNTIT
jgi:hypothetical protein